jgi:hypothetical protein
MSSGTQRRPVGFMDSASLALAPDLVCAHIHERPSRGSGTAAANAQV